jgi:flagellar biosynthesis/type III secretory pathway protein FliH
MTGEVWSSDPRFSKPVVAEEFTSLEATVEKTAAFVAGIEQQQAEGAVATSAPTPSSASYTQQQVDELVAAARAEGLAAGETQADQQFEQMQTQHKAHVDAEFAAFMTALKTDLATSQPLLQPIRDLAIALAEQIARVELSQSHDAINAVIGAVIDDLDPTDLGDIEIHVSQAWAERLKTQPLQGLTGSYPLVADENLYEGDVRVVVNNAQVEDLIADRVQQLAQQLDAVDFANIPEAEAEAEAEGQQETASIDDIADAEFEELPQIDTDIDEAEE